MTARTYTEAEVRAREAAAAEAMREEIAKHSYECGPEDRCSQREYCTCRRNAEDVRRVPIPHADALAAIRAEARREGMEMAAKWHDEQAAYCSKRASQRLAEGHRSAFGALKTVQATHENSAAAIRAAMKEEGT